MIRCWQKAQETITLNKKELFKLVKLLFWFLSANLIGFITCLYMVQNRYYRYNDSILLSKGNQHLIITPTHVSYMSGGYLRFGVSLENEPFLFINDEKGNLKKYIDLR